MIEHTGNSGSSPRAAVRGLTARCTLALALAATLAGCGNKLLSEVRDRQAETISPSIAVSKSDGASIATGGTFDFGDVAIGGSSSAKLTIGNSGKSDLIIAASGISLVSSSGTPDGTFSVSATTLDIKAGATASLSVLFNPAAGQTYTATLKIASNDLTTPSFTVKLSGTGSSTSKAFTSFGIQSPAETGVIDETNKTIAVTMPHATSLTGLIATFASTGAKVLVGSSVQTSGTTTNDFTNPVTYTVVAADGSTANYTVTVTLGVCVPSVTTGSTISSIGTTSAMGSGAITNDGGAAVTEVGLCWSSSSGTPTIADSHAASATVASSFSASLSSLSVGTTYYVRAYAKNSIGYGYGSAVNFITLPATPVISSVGPVSCSSGSGELAVAWSAAAGASAYNVYAYTSNSFSSASVISGGNGLSSSATSCTLTGLTNYTTYYVWVVASNSSGSTSSASLSGKVGVAVTGITLQRSADYVSVSGGRTTDTLIWDSTQSTSSIDALTAVITPATATNTAVSWTATGGVSVTTAGVISLSSAATGTVKATPADGQGGTTATITVSYISAAKGATNYTGPGGGKIFYDKGSYSNGWRYLEVYYNSGSGKCLYVPWGATGTTTGATLTAVGTGKENTDTIINKYGTTGTYGTGYMAYYCRFSFSNNGLTDWYLPSYTEVDTIRTVLGFANYTEFSTSTEMDSSYIYIYDNNYYGENDVQWTNCIKSFSSYLSLPTRRF